MVPPIVTGFNFNQVEMSRQVGLHSQLVSTLVGFGDGSNVGCNNANGKDCLTEDAAKSGKSLVAPGKNTLYTWYAGDRTECSPYAKDKNCLGELNKRLDALKGSDEDREKAAQKLMREGWTIHRPIEFGATSLTSMGDVIKHSSHGAIGALIIEPEGATWKTDADMDAAATVTSKDKKTSFREFVVLYQDDLSLRQGGEALFNLRNGDDAEDSGQKAFNYRTEPIWGRLGVGPGVEPNAMLDYKLDNAFSSKVRNAFCASPDLKKKPCDPMTPIFKAKAGDDVRFRVLHPAGHPRQHGFTVYGHNWYSTPWNEDSTKQEANPDSQNLVGSAGGIGPGKHLNLLMKAGGQFAVPGDYMYRSQEGFQFGGGLWGIFRVEPRSKTGRTNATQTRGKQTAR